MINWVKPLPIRSGGKTLVLCHGVFDLFHPGHMEHLRQAKAMGDYLVVTITADKYVSKGPGAQRSPRASGPTC